MSDGAKGEVSVQKIIRILALLQSDCRTLTWEHYKSQEKLKTMLINAKFWRTNNEYFGIFDIG